MNPSSIAGDAAVHGTHDRVECHFIDINTCAMQDYPEDGQTIHQVFLPMTVIDGVPRLHGYLDQGLIIETVREHLDKAE